jgi:Na+/melibiose symporter-like transporter
VVAAALLGAAALAAFVVVERRQRFPMLPLDIFASRQFSGANLVTFVVYAGLGGVLFLLATYLQTSLGYSPIEGGLALIPVTLLMLALSERAGALATRIGPRVPMSLGPLVLALGLLLMVRIRPGTTYQSSVLPAAVVFGLGLALTVAPLTATVLAAADVRHSGIASGVNNAVARVAQLLAVAILPVAAGITGDDFADPRAVADGFPVAVLIAAALSLLGAAVAWLTISNDVLAVEEAADVRAVEEAAPGRRPSPRSPGAAPERTYHCSVDGPPLRRRSPAASRPAGGAAP